MSETFEFCNGCRRLIEDCKCEKLRVARESMKNMTLGLNFILYVATPFSKNSQKRIAKALSELESAITDAT